MGSVAGGGRYDELVGMFDAKGNQVRGACQQHLQHKHTHTHTRQSYIILHMCVLHTCRCRVWA